MVRPLPLALNLEVINPWQSTCARTLKRPLHSFPQSALEVKRMCIAAKHFKQRERCFVRWSSNGPASELLVSSFTLLIYNVGIFNEFIWVICLESDDVID